MLIRTSFEFFSFFSFFFKFYFTFKLYKIVLLMPNIIMNPPQVYMAVSCTFGMKKFSLLICYIIFMYVCMYVYITHASLVTQW